MSCCMLSKEKNYKSSKPTDKEGIDSFAQAYMKENWFEAILANHEGDYLIGRTLHNLINEKHSSSIPG